MASEQQIYYVFRTDTYEYAGSGITCFDCDEHCCTTVPVPDFDESTINESMEYVVFTWNPDTQTWATSIAQYQH